MESELRTVPFKDSNVKLPHWRYPFLRRETALLFISAAYGRARARSRSFVCCIKRNGRGMRARKAGIGERFWEERGRAEGGRGGDSLYKES